MKISVSKVARWLIRRRGGERWVYAHPVGGGSGTSLISTSTSRRSDREFDQIDLDGLVVWFDRDLEIDDVRIAWTPLTGFDVTWPGSLAFGAGP